MRSRITPSFVVAVLALVVAAGGTGYAAGKITSADIKDGTIQGRDVKNGSLGRVDLDPACGSKEAAVFGGCVRLKSNGPTSHQAAIDDCNRRNGRLPTTLEIRWIAAHDEFTWADGNPGNYEFTGDYTAEYPLTPIGVDQNGFVVSNSSGQLFWHHCVTY